MLEFQGNLSPVIHHCILHWKKLRPREGKCLGQSHTARSGARQTPVLFYLFLHRRNKEKGKEGEKAGVMRYKNMNQCSAFRVIRTLNSKSFFFSFKKEMCFYNPTSMAGGKKVLRVPRDC